MTKLQATKLLNVKLLDLNFGFIDNVYEKDIEVNDRWHTLVEGLKVLPEDMNMLMPLFKELEIEVWVATTGLGLNREKGEQLHIRIEYTYEHHNGSNGYTCRFLYNDGSWKRVD